MDRQSCAEALGVGSSLMWDARQESRSEHDPLQSAQPDANACVWVYERAREREARLKQIRRSLDVWAEVWGAVSCACDAYHELFPFIPIRKLMLKSGAAGLVIGAEQDYTVDRCVAEPPECSFDQPHLEQILAKQNTSAPTFLADPDESHVIEVLLLLPDRIQLGAETFKIETEEQVAANKKVILLSSTEGKAITPAEAAVIALERVLFPGLYQS